MIDITPDPDRVPDRLGFPIYWYGIAYAVGLAAVYSCSSARRGSAGSGPRRSSERG